MCPPRAIWQTKTDCLVLQPARKLLPKLVAMGEIRHSDLPDLVQTHMGTEEGQRRLDEGAPLARSKDESHVFRWTRGPEVTWLQGHYREPELNVPALARVPVAGPQRTRGQGSSEVHRPPGLWLPRRGQELLGARARGAAPG